jgi:hypothetical protein
MPVEYERQGGRGEPGARMTNPLIIKDNFAVDIHRGV